MPGAAAGLVSSSLDGFTVLDSSSAANLKLDAGTTSSPGVTLGSNANYVSNTVTFSATMTRSAASHQVWGSCST